MFRVCHIPFNFSHFHSNYVTWANIIAREGRREWLAYSYTVRSWHRALGVPMWVSIKKMTVFVQKKIRDLSVNAVVVGPFMETLTGWNHACCLEHHLKWVLSLERPGVWLQWEASHPAAPVVCCHSVEWRGKNKGDLGIVPSHGHCFKHESRSDFIVRIQHCRFPRALCQCDDITYRFAPEETSWNWCNACP